MSTWKELHDDFLQEIVLYTEDVKLTEPQVMRYLTAGYAEFQRKTNILETTKAITPDGTPGTDPLETYDVGSDILEIHEVRDVDGYTLLQTSWQQFNDIIERTNSGGVDAFNGIGFNETPANYSQIRRRPGGDTYDRWGIGWGESMSRIYTIWEQKLYRYPANALDTGFTIWYRQRIDLFSASSPQWTAWFPAANFMAQFVGTGPSTQINQWERGIVAYAVAQFLRPKNVLTGNAPLWKQFQEEFDKVIIEAIETKPIMEKELQAPYHSGPY